MSIFGMSILDFVSNVVCATDAQIAARQKASRAQCHRRGNRTTVALSLSALVTLTVPVLALSQEDSYSPSSCQKAQVEDYLRARFTSEQASLRQGITIKTVSHECSDILMYGPPEQNPDLSTVRFTLDAKRFLDKCAATKGLTPKQ